MEVSGQLQLLYPQSKSPWYTLDRRVDGSQSQFGHGSEEKKFHHCPCWEMKPIA